eukprot:355657-Chlamydomonas_euryale.AAC.5
MPKRLPIKRLDRFCAVPRSTQTFVLSLSITTRRRCCRSQPGQCANRDLCRNRCCGTRARLLLAFGGETLARPGRVVASSD